MTRKQELPSPYIARSGNDRRRDNYTDQVDIVIEALLADREEDEIELCAACDGTGYTQSYEGPNDRYDRCVQCDGRGWAYKDVDAEGEID